MIGLSSLFERIEWCDRHQPMRAAACQQQPGRYRFGHARQRLDRAGDLVSGDDKVGDALPRLRPAR
jgi:hypothetical protein